MLNNVYLADRLNLPSLWQCIFKCLLFLLLKLSQYIKCLQNQILRELHTCIKVRFDHNHMWSAMQIILSTSKKVLNASLYSRLPYFRLGLIKPCNTPCRGGIWTDLDNLCPYHLLQTNDWQYLVRRPSPAVLMTLPSARTTSKFITFSRIVPYLIKK